MKIAIFSDTHGNAANFERALCWCSANDIGCVIHCGDIGSPEMFKEVIAGFLGKFFLVLGNADQGYGWDAGDLVGFSQMQIFEIIGETQLEDRKIGFCHFPDKAKELAMTGKYDFVFYGHLHIPWVEKIGECYFVNPGTLGGIFSKPTFAVLDLTIGKLELKLLETLIERR